uniref:Uncharacterized protein n=1 Tax=Picea glauca TaxID=3330 RepID=A0A117NJC3_PICGL|nr:hypothetical protein ABT39_MTgene1077 [Picea glauca]
MYTVWVGVHSMYTVWVGVSCLSRNALCCLGVLSLSRSVPRVGM